MNTPRIRDHFYWLGYATPMERHNASKKLALVDELIQSYINSGLLRNANIDGLEKQIDSKFLSEVSPSSIVKNSEELYREYESEKWSQELVRIAAIEIESVESIHSLFIQNDKDLIVRIYDNLYETNLLTARSFFTDCLAIILGDYFSEVETVLDIGSGTGATIIPLLTKLDRKDLNLYATDISPSGLAGLDKIAQSLKIKTVTSVQDFFQGFRPSFDLPEQSLILTSFSLSCIPKLAPSFFPDLINLSPKYVVHIESVYEYLTSGKLLDTFSKKYVEWNDYNKDLLTQLKISLAEDENYEIKFELQVFFGQNPVFPLSIVCWGVKE
jgi:SAM-dependent methyltransferase